LLVESSAPYIIVARSLAQNKKEVSLRPRLARQLDMLQDTSDPCEKVLGRDIKPLMDERLVQKLIEIISRIAERIVKENSERSKLSLRLLKIVKSVETIIEDEGSEVSQSIQMVTEYLSKQCPEQLKSITSKETTTNTKVLAEDAEKPKSGATEVISTVTVNTLITIKLISEKKNVENNFKTLNQSCLQQALHIAYLINFKRALWKLYSGRKNKKLIPQAVLNPLSIHRLLELAKLIIKGEMKPLELRAFLLKYDIHIELFEKLDKLYRQLMKFKSINTFSTPQEFYFVDSLIERVISCGNCYIQTIVQIIKSPELASSFNNLAIPYKVEEEIDCIMKEYAQWLNKRIREDIKETRVKAKRKLTRAKWEEEQFMLRMQKIAKKRRGMQKQGKLEYRSKHKHT